MDKLLKTIESLKVPAFSLGTDGNITGSITSAVVAASDAIKTKKKERIEHCVAVTDSVLNPNVQNLMEFPKILESVTEVLFQLCNDLDSDIRLVAVDCLNRIVRTLRGILLNKFQLEVYREIKKSQAPRSLRTALSIFATMSSDIRPGRCRGFIQSLLPSLVLISRRTEELIYENLATSFLQILKNLGLFLTDADVKLLCKEYLKNLESSSTVVRRSSASILVYVCQFSRKPNIFLPRLLMEVIQLLMPKLMETSVSTLIGALLCIRQCISPLYDELETPFPGIVSKDTVFQNIVQVYEICLILCNHDDHNVITTSLETLQQLLTRPVFEVVRRLTFPDGIKNSFDSEQWVKDAHTGTSQSQSRRTSIGSEGSESDVPPASSPLLDTGLDLPTFRSELSSAGSERMDEHDTNVSFTTSRRDSDVFIMASTSEADAGSNSSSEDLQSEDDTEKYARLTNTIALRSFPELQIGSLYDASVPLHYCTRFLAYNFLLAGKQGYERSDDEIRVTVKVLAINCMINSIQLCPHVFLLPLSSVEPGVDETETQQMISDVSLYSKHHDPLLRGSTYLLIGHFLNQVLREESGARENKEVQIEELIATLNTGLLDQSNIGVKYALSGVSECLVSILRSGEGVSRLGELFENLFATSSNPYWLVKVHLTELLAAIEWDSVTEYEQVQDRTLNLFCQLLSDEDVRVRSSTVSALTNFIQSCGKREDWILGRTNPFSSKAVITAMSCDIFKFHDKERFHSSVSKHLEKVLDRIIPQLRSLHEKHSIASYYYALSSLAESFPPSVYQGSWKCGGNEIPVLFSVTVELLRASSHVSDVYIHQNLLSLASALFIALMKQNTVVSSTDENSPFIGSQETLSFYGLSLLNHCSGVLKLYSTLLKSNAAVPTPKKQSPLSPAKKVIGKDAEKVMDADKKSKAVQRQQSNSSLGPTTMCPVQLKRIEESLLQSWKVYKSNLDPVVTHKFTLVLVTSMDTLGALFSWARCDYAGLTSVIEHILAISPIIFNLTPVPTLKCMKQILRCLNSPCVPVSMEDKVLVDSKDSLDEFQKFCDNFYKSFPAGRRSDAYKNTTEKSCLGNYIRSFEPIVISALKTYLASSDSMIQAEILLFVSELIKGHVNYAMVDSNQVFLSAVIKQLTFLEEGQFRNSAVVVDAIFEYFTHLSHTERQTKKFIDTPKMIQLCDGLVASGQNPATNYVPAMKKIVQDLFVCEGYAGVTNLEKKELEAQREVLFQNSLKLLNIPNVLPIIFAVLHGRRGISEAKWSTESGIIAKAILDSIESNQLVINNSPDFNCLVAILLSVDATSLPSLCKLMGGLNTALELQTNDPSSVIRWMVSVNSFWIVILRIVHHREELIPSQVILDVVLKFVENVQKITEWSTSCRQRMTEFVVEQLLVFIKVTSSCLSKATSGEAILLLSGEDKLDEFLKISQEVGKLSRSHPQIREALCEFLTVLAYPWTDVWDIVLLSFQLPSAKEIFLTEFVASLVSRLVPTADPRLEKWLIQNYFIYILHHSHSPAIMSFWTRISDSSRDLLMQKLVEVTNMSNLCVPLVLAVLRFMERAYEAYKATCAMLCIKLLKMKTLASVSFEISQFACFLYVHLQGQEQLFSLEDTEVLKDFTLNRSIRLRFPRLVSLIIKFLGDDRGDDENGASDEYANHFREGPISAWCSESVNATEGAALATILSNLNYREISNVLSLPKFNLAILKYVFKHLHSQTLHGLIPLEELMTLMTTEKHSNLITASPLGVAVLDWVVELLDAWETLIPESLLVSFNSEISPSVLNVPFSNNLFDMWATLTKLLELKATILAGLPSRQETCEAISHNNYIPTRVFTFSFQYMRVICQNKELPIHQLIRFLQFSCTAVNDASFLQFFNVRDSHFLLFNCIDSLGFILRRVISHFAIPYVSLENDESWDDLNETCAMILREFNFMLDVLGQVKCGKLLMEPILYELIKTLVAGLARCELVNGWLLISHLGWKPPLITTSMTFPPIYHIPLETLQGDKDLLLKYILKLHYFGITSKIQFEENWMTFLSVINSFGDEHHNLQIIIVGLHALSMMLEQSVKVVYTLDLSGQKRLKGMEKVNLALHGFEPKICAKCLLPLPYSLCQKTYKNGSQIDVTSCIRFLIDLFSQWMQNIQGKMPLLLITRVVENIIHISKYFDDTSQYVWMFDTLMEIYKGCEKEDDALWSHLVYGMFIAASHFTLEAEMLVSIGQTLEGALSSPSANVANGALEAALIYFQNQPESPQLLNIVVPYILNFTQLSETLNDSETHSYNAWKLLLFIWIYCSPNVTCKPTFEQDVLGNVLTVLSPLNKVHISIRLLVLRSLRTRVEIGGLEPEAKKLVSKVALDTLRTPNLGIFFESIILYLTIFYGDFSDFYGVRDADPEVLIQMAERYEILFQLVKNGRKYPAKIASKVLPILVMDFLPPSEILNRVFSQFLSPNQIYPELLAPTIAQIFEKARQKPQEALLVREWIIASLPNFVASPDVSRTMWNLTLFFVGISTTPDLLSLLPFAQLRRNPFQMKKMFIHSVLDYYIHLSLQEQQAFESIMRKGPFSSSNNPYAFLLDIMKIMK